MSVQTLPRRAAPATDVFRPRLPLDPFAPAASAVQESQPDPDTPWPANDLPALEHAFSLTPAVILVLGAPTPHALSPLLRSPTFARSLVLLVTHSPPPLSALRAALGPGANPAHHAAIRVLRLRAPLVPSAPAFALTLVAVLDAAAAVARAWRARALSPNGDDEDRILQLAQSASGDAAFSVREPLQDFAEPAPPPALGSSANEHLHPAGTPQRRGLSPYAPTASRARPPSALGSGSDASLISKSLSRPSSRRNSAASLSSNKSALSTTSSKRSSKFTPLDKSDGTRPFDALLSFLPPAQPEKAVLKQVVLVSTLAGGFLAGAGVGATASIGGYNWNNASADAYLGNSPSPSLSRPGSVSSHHSQGFDWNSAPPSPSLGGHGFGSGTSSAETSRPGTPASIGTKRKSRFSLFGGGGTSKSQPASRRGSVYDVVPMGASVSAGSASTLQMSAHAHARGAGAGARAHIVHVLPASYRSTKLVGALSAFCASLGGGGGGGRGAKAYVLGERALGSVGCVVVGALEAAPTRGAGMGEFGTLERTGEGQGQGGRRRGAWVAGVMVPAESPDEESEGDGANDNDNEKRRELELEGEGREGWEGGLPTPPVSRSGSGEDEDEGGSPTTSITPPPAAHTRSPSSSAGHAWTPSASGHGHARTPSAAGHGHVRRPSAARSASGHGHGQAPPVGVLPPGARAPSIDASHTQIQTRPQPQQPAHKKLRRISTSGQQQQQQQQRRGSVHDAQLASQQAPAPVPAPTPADAQVLRTPSGRRRVDSAPDLGPQPAIGAGGRSRSKGGEGGAKKTWSRGSRFFGGKSAGDFSLRGTPAPTPTPTATSNAAADLPPAGRPTGREVMGRSSPDLRELPGGGGPEPLGGGEKEKSGRRKKWWAFWGS